MSTWLLVFLCLRERQWIKYLPFHLQRLAWLRHGSQRTGSELNKVGSSWKEHEISKLWHKYSDFLHQPFSFFLRFGWNIDNTHYFPQSTTRMPSLYILNDHQSRCRGSFCISGVFGLRKLSLVYTCCNEQVHADVCWLLYVWSPNTSPASMRCQGQAGTTVGSWAKQDELAEVQKALLHCEVSLVAFTTP